MAPAPVATSYYEKLGIARTASTDEVKTAYRKLSLKFHPERASGPKGEAAAAFAEIAEAYDVLSHPARRAIFDQYGEQGLKDGIPDGHGGVKGGTYRFSGNALEIFQAFFGTASPFADILGAMGEEPPAFYGELTGMTLPKKPAKPAAKTVPLVCTLAEIYNGVTKKVSFTRKTLRADLVAVDEDKDVQIKVLPGWEAGTEVTFPGQGDEGVDIQPGDVTVILEIAPAAGWAREGSSLIYTTPISLADALCGCVVDVPTLDGRILSVPVNQIVAPGATKVVPGEGMVTAEGTKGDLILAFDISFPKTLKAEQKAALKKALS